MSPKTLKLLGFIVSIASAGLSVIAGVLDDKKMSRKVAEEVAKQLESKVKGS